jgi:hypothetical protein
MNRFKKAGTMMRAAAAFSRKGDAKGLLNAESEHTEENGGAEGSVNDSKHGSSSPKREGDPEYNEESAEKSPKKGRRGGLLSALSDRKLLGGGYCANLNTGDDDNSDNLDDDGNEIKLAPISAAPTGDTANRIGELPSKPVKESPTDKTVNGETNQIRARRSQQPPSAQRRFRKTKAKEEATVKTDKDNEDLEATVAQVEDDGGEGGYSQLVLSERGEAPEQSPELPGPDPEVSLTTHSADTATSHGDDDSANETDYEDKPSPNEKDERRGRSERTSKGTRPKNERGSSRKPESRGNPKERPRKPGEKRRSIEHDPKSRRKSNDSVETDLLADEEGALGEESAMPKNVEKKGSRAWPSAQKVKDSEKEKSKDAEKGGTKKAWPSAAKVNSKHREKPKERELLGHLDKEKKKSDRGGVKRENSSKSLFVGTRKEEGKSGETSPTMSVGVRDRGLRRSTDTNSQSEKGAGSGSLLGQMRSAVSERNLITSSEHTPSMLGPATSDSLFHSDHGLDLGPLGSPSLDVGPAGSDSAALAALTTLNWTPRPASPLKKPKPAAGLEKDDDKPNGDSASGTPEKRGPDGTVVASAGSPDHDESTRNKASKESSKPRRDGKESSGATSSSKRNESSSSKSKRDGKDDIKKDDIKKDESTNGKHSRESRDTRTRSRPESRQRGHSVQPEARSRGTSVRAQARGKEAPVTSERRRRRPSMGGSGAVLDGQGESRRNLASSDSTATAQIASESNDLSVVNVPPTPGPEDASGQDSTPKAAEDDVTKEPKDLGSPTKGSPTKKSPKHVGSPTKKSPRHTLSPSKTPKGSSETDALPQAPLSSSKQNGAKKTGSPRHSVPPKSPKSPRRERRSSLGSPRRRMKTGSSPTGDSPKISLQLAMALTGPPNLDEGDESSEVDKSTDEGVAKIEANSAPSDDVKSSADIVLSEDVDEASEDPLFEDWSDAADDTSLLESFGSSPHHPRNAAQEQRVQVTAAGQTNEDWSDAADDEGVLESFGVKSANLDRGSEHSSVTAQSYSHHAQESVGKWSDAADESEVANQEESLDQSTVADQEKRAQESVVDEESEIPATVHAEIVPETTTAELTTQDDLGESKQNSETNVHEQGVQESIETKAGDDVAETPNDNAAAEDNIISASPEAVETMETDKEDENNVEETLERSESNGSAFLEDYEKQMKGISLEVENEVPLMYMSDMVSGKSASEGLDGTDLALATDSVYDKQAAETAEDGENKYASSSVYALLSSELAGSKERLAETRLEVSQLEKEVDLLRLRLNALERTLS